MGKSLRVTVLFFLVLIFISPIGYGNSDPRIQNDPHPLFESITQENGLSQSSVYAILQDHMGFIWLGTGDGLNRFDGYSFKIYRFDPMDTTTLSDNWITALIEDRHGRIWIGTHDNGINLFDRVSDSFVRYEHDDADPHSLSDNRVNDLYEDVQGRIWVATAGGINRYDPEIDGFRVISTEGPETQVLSTNGVITLTGDPRNADVLWAGTWNGGLNRLSVSDGTVTHYRHDPNDPNSLSSDVVWTLHFDLSGRLWIGTQKGLDLFHKSQTAFTHFKHDPDNSYSLRHNDIRGLLEDSNGRFWVGTDDGLHLFYPEKGRFIRFVKNENRVSTISDNRIRCLYEDRSGLVWIGTFTGGVIKAGGIHKQFTHVREDPESSFGLSNRFVKAVFQDHDGNVWVGTWDGITILDHHSRRMQILRYLPQKSNSLSSNKVLTILESKDSTFWIGTWGDGLNHYDPQTGLWTLYQHDQDNSASLSNNFIRCLTQDKQGNLWIGTDIGLDRYDPENDTFGHFQHDPAKPTSISSNFIRSILEDHDGYLWIGTANGLNKFNPQEGTFTRFLFDTKDTLSLSSNRITSLCEDSQGTLWVGTQGGVNRYSPETKSFHRYTMKNGLPNDMIYGILEDNSGHLWLSTNNGLCQFDPQTETVKNYTRSHGLQHNEFNFGAYHRGAKGELFFGGINGLTRFFPSEIKDNPNPPPIVLTAFKIKGAAKPLFQVLNPTGQIRLRHDQNYFSVEFAALDFTHPNQNRYAYKLANIDRDWINLGHRHFVNFTNLDGGNYVLHIKGSNSDQVWNEAGIAIPVHIATPPWQSWWAYLFYTGMGVLVIGLYIRTQTKKHEEELRYKNEQVRHLQQLDNFRAEALKSQERYRQLFEDSSDAIFITQQNGWIIDINPSAEALFKASRADIREIDPSTFFVNKNEYQTIMNSLLKKGHIQDYPVEIRTRAGDIRPCQLTAGIRRDESQTVIGFQGHIRDLSERVKMEQQLRSLVKRLQDQQANLKSLSAAVLRAQEDERKRISRELHDEIGQSLTAINLGLQVLKKRLPDEEEIQSAIRYCQEMTEYTAGQIHRFSFELRPSALDDLGLLPAMKAHARDFMEQTDMTINIDNRGNVEDILPNLKTTLFRIYQEGVTNAAKHAQTDTVNVALEVSANQVILTVKDHGRGFDTAQLRQPSPGQGGLGIMGIQERLELEAGSVDIDSAPGKGTRLTVKIPLNDTPGGAGSE